MSDLETVLREVPGVAEVELDLVSGSVKVVLEAGASHHQVGALVREVLAESGLRSRLVPPRRRPAEPPAPIPPIIVPSPAPPVRGEIDWVEVREAGKSVSVVVSLGGKSVERMARATRQGLHDALAEAVASLVGSGPIRLLSVSEHQDPARGGASAVSVMVERADGSAAVGGSLVVAGWEPAIARAVMTALLS